MDKLEDGSLPLIRVLNVPDAAPVLFPEQDISKFLAYVRDVWTELRAAAPVWWTNRRETKLVEAFFAELDNDERRVKAGIGFGHFTNENHLVDFGPDGMPKQVGRTDICFMYAVNFGPHLILEFKRLDNKARLEKAYATDGVKRFGSGQYAKNVDFGVMVGLVDGAVAQQLTRLQAHLLKTKVMAETQSNRLANPSHLPELDFDTHHHRPHCASQDICVGHMLLER